MQQNYAKRTWNPDLVASGRTHRSWEGCRWRPSSPGRCSRLSYSAAPLECWSPPPGCTSVEWRPPVGGQPAFRPMHLKHSDGNENRQNKFNCRSRNLCLPLERVGLFVLILSGEGNNLPLSWLGLVRLQFYTPLRLSLSLSPFIISNLSIFFEPYLIPLPKHFFLLFNVLFLFQYRHNLDLDNVIRLYTFPSRSSASILPPHATSTPAVDRLSNFVILNITEIERQDVQNWMASLRCWITVETPLIFVYHVCWAADDI